MLDEGFLGAYNGAPDAAGSAHAAPVPVAFTAAIRSDPTHYLDTSSDGTGCDVDVNGDGKRQRRVLQHRRLRRDRRADREEAPGLNISLQGDLGGGFKLTSDMFYTNEKSYDRQTGYQLNSATWDGATFLPIERTQYRRAGLRRLQRCRRRRAARRLLRHLAAQVLHRRYRDVLRRQRDQIPVAQFQPATEL